MSFEEEFPSLWANHWIVETAKAPLHLLLDGSNEDEYHSYCLTPIELKRWDSYVIEEHCLDKQRVKEAIKKAKNQLDFKYDYHNSCESMASIQFIECELGLEEEE